MPALRASVVRARRTLALLAILLGATWAVAMPTARAAQSSDALSWPQRRFAPCAALDEARGAWYVFGGRGEGAAAHFADAWRLDVRRRAPRWERVADAAAPDAPPPVRSCAAAFDTDGGRMLVFGGWDGVTATNGVWAFGSASGWERLCDAGSCGTPPSPRRAAQAVYDPVGRRLLVFGGFDTTYRNDTWELTLDGRPAWHRLPAGGPQPPPRASHSLVYDAEHRRAWLFGGTTLGADLGDTWTLDPASASWQPVACAAACPAARSGAVLAYDAGAGRLVLHGGWESTVNRYPRDTWTLEDLGATPHWRHAQPDSEDPQRRAFGVGAYDPGTRRMLEFGGGIGATALKDVAALELGDRLAWHGLAPRTPLTARDQVALAYSPRSRVVLAFGGYGSGTFPGRLEAGTHLADSWSRHGGAWRRATPPVATDLPPNPLHREAAAVATDSRRDRMVMIGGLEGDDELADVWAAALRGGPARWRQLCSPASCGPGPSARWGANAVYDRAGDRVILFGGRRTDGTSLADVWALSLAGAPRWARLDVAGAAPAGRWGAAAGLDPAGRRMVIAGGQAGDDAAATSLGDAWALSLDGPPAWRALAPPGAAPAPRRSAAYAMRVTEGTAQLLIAGGLNAGSGTHFNDIWALTLDGDGAAWSQLTGSACADATAPACRRSASAVYDPHRDRLLVAFGRDGQRFYADTWTFDVRGRRWAELPG